MPQEFYPIAALTISTCAFCISVIMLFLAIKRDSLKKGIHVRGTFSTCSDHSCEDKYIGSIYLENLKDRAVTILAIYLEIGNGCFLEIENLDETPLILKPFETYHKRYGPIVFYISNDYKVNLNGLIENRKFKKRIVLTTSEGKYIVGTFMPLWNPLTDYFRNHLTQIIHPMRTTYKEHDIGSNVKFILEMKFEKGTEEITLLHPGDYRLKLFRSFQLTKESLESKVALETYLNSLLDQGIFQCKSFEVFDAQEWHEQQFKLQSKKRVEAQHFGKFTYYVLGRLYSIWGGWQMKRRNKATAKEYERKMKEASMTKTQKESPENKPLQ